MFLLYHICISGVFAIRCKPPAPFPCIIYSGDMATWDGRPWPRYEGPLREDNTGEFVSVSSADSVASDASVEESAFAAWERELPPAGDIDRGEADWWSLVPEPPSEAGAKSEASSEVVPHFRCEGIRCRFCGSNAAIDQWIHVEEEDPCFECFLACPCVYEGDLPQPSPPCGPVPVDIVWPPGPPSGRPPLSGGIAPEAGAQCADVAGFSPSSGRPCSANAKMLCRPDSWQNTGEDSIA